ncbi:hypothetical protein BSKO_10535 [Bryopsis sp. KO-2023]|nr:hypothetical protein BSKO_10535 [Bryopsis sp. KO-2023]
MSMSKVVGMSQFVGRSCATPLSVKRTIGRTALVSGRRCPIFARRVSRTITRATEGGENGDADTKPLETTSSEKQAVPPPSPAGKEEEMGIVGQIIAWGFLSVLFAASIFFTFSRQFLPDLVPLDMNNSPF